MTLDEFKDALRAILAEEDQAVVDWGRVAALSLGAVGRLATEPEPDYPDDIYHFLDDYDIRQRDAAYAKWQREQVRAYLA